MFKRLSVVLLGIKYSIKKAIAFERALGGISKRTWFSYKGLKKGELFKLNPWIDYIAIHSTLTYFEAIDLYDRCTSLPWKMTKCRAKQLTKLIINQVGVGHSGKAIDIGILAVSIEVKEKKLIKRDKKGAKK